MDLDLLSQSTDNYERTTDNSAALSRSKSSTEMIPCSKISIFTNNTTPIRS
jgi:hypothetical protein